MIRLMKCAPAATVALLAVSLTIATAARAATWTEVGDAGGPTSPQVTQGTGGLTSVVGNFGGALDPADAFLFATDGVSGLNISAFIDFPSYKPEAVGLYDTQGVLLTFGMAYLYGINLAPGSYVIQISAFEAEAPEQPPEPYTISFSQPVSFAQSVPEPSVLLLGGAAVLLIRRRR
jgi:hypothetical protein